jgi:hypothetical protein
VNPPVAPPLPFPAAPPVAPLDPAAAPPPPDPPLAAEPPDPSIPPPLPPRAAWPPAPASSLDDAPPEQPTAAIATTIGNATTAPITLSRNVTPTMALIVNNLSFNDSSSARSFYLISATADVPR